MVWQKKIDENSKTRFWKALSEHRPTVRKPIPKKASNGWAQFSDFVLDRNHSNPLVSPSFQTSFSESSPQPVFKPISNSSNQQQNSYSRVNALEEETIQIQNELKGTKTFEKTGPLHPKKEKSPKSNRVKILEEYLKKT